MTSRYVVDIMCSLAVDVVIVVPITHPSRPLASRMGSSQEFLDLTPYYFLDCELHEVRNHIHQVQCCSPSATVHGPQQ